MVKSLLSDDNSLKKRPLFFYGAGNWCRKLMESCQIIGMRPDFIVDRDSRIWGSTINGVSVISPVEMQKSESDCPVIISTYFIKSAELSLKEYGFHNLWHFPRVGDLIRCFGLSQEEIEQQYQENYAIISNVAQNLADQRSVEVFNGNILRRRANWDNFEDIADPDEYFCPDVIKLGENEVFLDGGGYDGRTTLDFIERTKGKFNHIYVFEPIPEMVGIINENLAHCMVKEKISVINAAIDERPNSVRFMSLGMGSHINASGEIEVRAESIDDFFKDKEPPTYMTFDIEGAELQAIRGANETITRHKPKLAVSIYHKFNDLWEIPSFLMSKYLFYDIYIRHHYIGVLQTVCYAIPKEGYKVQLS